MPKHKVPLALLGFTESEIMQKQDEYGKHYKKGRVLDKFKSYLKAGEAELKEYRKSKNKDNTTTLAEAGEKLWGSVNHLIELKSGKSLTTSKAVWDEVHLLGDQHLITIYETAYSLHQFFYGYTGAHLEEITERADQVINGLKGYLNANRE
jgi:hypothetical protein